MRLSIASIVGLAVCPVWTGCPYARDVSIRAEDQERAHPYSPRPTVSPDSAASLPSSPNSLVEGKKGLFLMNRIAPGSSKLYISNADGSNERTLLKDSIYEYHAEFTSDGKWITFTGERNGFGNSDIYKVRPDGSELQPIVESPAVEDSVVLSPNGTFAAYVSTANSYKANIWVKNLKTGAEWNITDTPANRPNESMMAGHFHPAWSPDGEWLAFSSDRNTPWQGHGNFSYFGLVGWEHTQELAIYVVHPDGSDLRRVAHRNAYCLGSPKWSPDGTRIVFYEMTREATWDAHRTELVAAANSSIISIGFDGKNRRTEAEGPGVKICPQYITDSTIGYLVKAGTNEGFHLTDGSHYKTAARSPSWSPDGKLVVYEKTSWEIPPLYKELYSWDNQWDYRYTDVFPQLSSNGKVVITQKYLGNSSIVTYDKEGRNVSLVYDPNPTDILLSKVVAPDEAGAYNPNWSSDGEWLVFGVGSWFGSRPTYGGQIMRSTANGSYTEIMISNNNSLAWGGKLNNGFPSFSHDGKKVVYRVWSSNNSIDNGTKTEIGLRVIDLQTKIITQLTTGWDNFPAFSPDGEHVLFTRKITSTNYQVCTIRADGSDLRVLTSSGANDAHAVWRQDGKIMWSTGMFGFQSESALYDNTFQPYSQIMIMDPDGSHKRALTNSLWEDSMPLFIPNDGF